METKQELVDVKPQDTNHELTLPKQQELTISPDAPLAERLIYMVASGISIDTVQIKAVQEICREQDADNARKSFATAFTLVQADVAAAVKTARNEQTNSNYAKLDAVIDACKPVYTEHGFSVMFREGVTEKEGHIRICADVLHTDGHEKEFHLDVPLGGKGVKGTKMMTDLHAKLTSISYGERYLLCMIWNIPTKDVDGNVPPAPPPKPADIPDPTEAEAEVIRLICHAMPHVDGMVPSPFKIGRLFYVNGEKRDYPSNPDTVIAVCEWFVGGFQDSQLYDEIK